MGNILLKFRQQNFISDRNDVGFSKSPRSNFLIEIIRFLALFALVIQHCIHFGSLEHVSGFTKFIVHTTDHGFNVWAFTAITGIFTIGKGKSFFLRNLSRQIFVILIVIAIAIPIFNEISSDTTGQISYKRILFGGRDIWYIWGITICSFFFPLIKIDKLLVNNYATIFFGAAFTLIIVLPGPFWIGIFKIFSAAFGAFLMKEGISKLIFKNKQISLGILASLLLIGNCLIAGFFNSNAIAALSWSLFIIFLSGFSIKTPKYFNFIVRNSYFVYELHFIFQLVWKWIERNHIGGYNASGFTSDLEIWEFILGVFAMSLIASFVVSTIQIYIWEPLFGGKLLYRIKINSFVYLFVGLLVLIANILYAMPW